MAKGNRHKRTITELVESIYNSTDNSYINNLFLAKFLLNEEFSNQETKEVFDKLIVFIFKECYMYGNVNIHNFATFKNEKDIKLSFNKNIKQRLKKLNEFYAKNMINLVLCDDPSKVIVFTKKFHISEFLVEDFNIFLRKYLLRNKNVSKKGNVWKYILVEFYTLFFIKSFEHVTDLLFKHYMVDIEKIGIFCFKKNKRFGLYIKYEYNDIGEKS